MNSPITTSLLAIALAFTSSSCFAKWSAAKDKSINGRWDVTNSKSGQTVQFDSEKEARKGARILNKADKSVKPLPGGEGDYADGGLPK